MTARLIFEQRSLLPVNAQTAFEWHERPGALQRLTPPWEQVRVVSTPASLKVGERAEIQVKMGPLWKTWIAEHTRYVPGREFQDTQVSGPFALFEHTHKMEPADDSSCWLTDHIEYIPPGGWLGRVLGQRFLQAKLQRMFRFRHAVTHGDLAGIAAGKESQPMKILISGATGLVGTALTPRLTTTGHEVVRLTRSKSGDANDIVWDPQSGKIDATRFEGIEGVVHLAGENIAGARWTTAVKQRIRDSRVTGTRLLCEALAKLAHPPKVLVCASAIGYYGYRGDEMLSEESAPGNGFLPEVCREWEEACEPARQAGIRVVNLRIGVVLSPKGGALQKMLFPFKMGGGGIVGSGRQYWSWIGLEDLVGSIVHCLTHEEIHGPVNATAPNPATNYDFTKTLGSVLHRPTLIPLPAFAARLALGQMADDLLLSSARVVPQKLLSTGYQFRHPTLEETLRYELGL